MESCLLVSDDCGAVVELRVKNQHSTSSILERDVGMHDGQQATAVVIVQCPIQEFGAWLKARMRSLEVSENELLVQLRERLVVVKKPAWLLPVRLCWQAVLEHETADVHQQTVGLVVAVVAEVPEDVARIKRRHLPEHAEGGAQGLPARGCHLLGSDERLHGRDEDPVHIGVDREFIPRADETRISPARPDGFLDPDARRSGETPPRCRPCSRRA